MRKIIDETNQSVNVSPSTSSWTDQGSATVAGKAGAYVGTVWEEDSGSESTGKRWAPSSEARVSASAACHREYERTTDCSADSGGVHLLCLSFCRDLATWIIHYSEWLKDTFNVLVVFYLKFILFQF